MTDPAPTKYRVTMRNYTYSVSELDDEGRPVAQLHEATDYVHPEHLDAYLADANKNWAFVEVSEEPDAGPAGYNGEYTLPAHIDHPEAGVTRPATEES